MLPVTPNVAAGMHAGAMLAMAALGEPIGVPTPSTRAAHCILHPNFRGVCADCQRESLRAAREQLARATDEPAPLVT